MASYGEWLDRGALVPRTNRWRWARTNTPPIHDRSRLLRAVRQTTRPGHAELANTELGKIDMATGELRVTLLVPIGDENGFVLFESGAIVFHIGEPAWHPCQKTARATQCPIAPTRFHRALRHEFAHRSLHANLQWAKLCRPGAVEFV
jgi:hypothetical protein